jgi:hypothetical protein
MNDIIPAAAGAVAVSQDASSLLFPNKMPIAVSQQEASSPAVATVGISPTEEGPAAAAKSTNDNDDDVISSSNAAAALPDPALSSSSLPDDDDNDNTKNLKAISWRQCVSKLGTIQCLETCHPFRCSKIDPGPITTAMFLNCGGRILAFDIHLSGMTPSEESLDKNNVEHGVVNVRCCQMSSHNLLDLRCRELHILDY